MEAGTNFERIRGTPQSGKNDPGGGGGGAGDRPEHRSQVGNGPGAADGGEAIPGGPALRLHRGRPDPAPGGRENGLKFPSDGNLGRKERNG